MRRLLIVLAALALLVPGCGGGSSSGGNAQQVLSETASNLGKIRSGELALELSFGGMGSDKSGFQLNGPFALKQGALPEAQLDYTQIAGSKSVTSTFISTGDKAYVSTRGVTYVLPPKLADQVRSAVGTGTALGQQFDLSSWIEEPELLDGGDVGGASTDKVSARLNVVNAVNSLLQLASQLQSKPALSTPQSQAQVRRAVEKATIDVWTGKDDRLLRKLDISIKFSPTASQKVKSLVGASLLFHLAITNPNEQIHVEAPQNTQPYPGS